MKKYIAYALVCLFYLSVLPGDAAYLNYNAHDITSDDGVLSGFDGVYDNNIANVKDPRFGAVGDNVTNDTAAIQAAIDTGLPVYIPPGTYAVDTINVHGHFRIIKGAGGAPTMYSGLDLSAQTTTLRARGTGPVLDVQLHHNSFYNINFDGNYTADNVVLIHPYTTKTLFSRCTFNRHATGGKQVVIRDNDTEGEVIQDDFNVFERSVFQGYDNTGTGAYVTGSNTQKQMFDRCYFTNLSTGIYVRGGMIDVIDSQFEQCAWAGIQLYGGGAPGRIVGNYTETTGMYFIRMDDADAGGDGNIDATLVVMNNTVNADAYNVFYNYYTILSVGNLYKGQVSFNNTVTGGTPKPMISVGDNFNYVATVVGNAAGNVNYVGSIDNTHAIMKRAAPADAAEACQEGISTWDSNFKYLCYPDNTWKRFAYDTSTPFTGGGSSIADNSVTAPKLSATAGTASATTYYRGDNTWAVPEGSGSATSIAWDNVTGRPTFNGIDLDGAALDAPANYPTLNQSTTGNATTATTATALSAQYVDWSQSSGATSVANRPTINGAAVTGAVLDNVSNYPTFNQNTTGNATTATTATALSGQYIDWAQSSGATSVANRPTINGIAVTGAVLDNASNLPTIALGTGTSGNYVADITAGGFLALTGTEGATLGLQDNCALNEIPKWNGAAWACAADAGTPSAGNPSFDNVQSGTNTSATMTLGAGGTLTFADSGVVNASQYRGITAVDNNEFSYLDNVSSSIQVQIDAKQATITDNSITPARLQYGSGSAGATTFYRGDGAWIVPTDTDTIVTGLPWDNITSRPTINSVDVTGAVLDNVSNYPSGLERTANKGTDNTLGTSDTIYPSQKATKQYVDGVAAGKQTLDVDLTSIAGGVTGLVKGAGNGAGYSAATSGVDYPPIASPTFTGVVTIPTPFTLGAVSVTATGDELNYVDGVTSLIQDQLDSKAPIASPTLTGTVTFPTWVMFGADNVAINQNLRTTDNVTFNSVTAAEHVSTATDNTRGVAVPNTADPTGANLELGQIWYNTTSEMVKVRDSDNNATQEVFTSGASHTLNFATTGTLTGGIMVLDNVVGPTAAQCYGAWNTITTAGTVTLPAVAAGMSHCVATEGALEITVELDGSDTFVLAGVTMDAGEAIINTTGEAAGDYICFIGTSTSKWRVAGKQGTWTQATP